jgi:hypothetical protein
VEKEAPPKIFGNELVKKKFLLNGLERVNSSINDIRTLLK